MAPDVSIVIVSMNKTEYLFPCLDSIREHTSVTYETLVVASQGSQWRTYMPQPTFHT